MENVSISEVFAIQQSWDYFLYVVLVLQVILLAVLFAGTMRDVIFIAVTMICAIADKAYIFGFLEGNAQNYPQAINFHTKESFLTYAARVIMFALPLVIITQTKVKYGRPTAALVAIISMVYAFTRWFFQQFPEGQSDFNTQNLGLQAVFAAQVAWVYVMLGHSRLKVYWSPPNRPPQHSPEHDT